jgi:HAD superfamily hydrolase (TIGR01509 family)
VRLRPPFRPEGVVFDLDGLLVDSEAAWGRAERRVVVELGHPWDPAVRPLLLGRGPRDAARVLADFLGGHDPEDIDRRLLVAAEQEFADGVGARPGARALIDALDGQLGLAVATNSRRVLAELALAGAGLAGRFAAVVCVEDVAAPKPAPDPYATACQLLGCDPGRAVAFEDSPVGVSSAKAAGMWVVGCPSVPGVTMAAADVVVGTLADIVVGTLAHLEVGGLGDLEVGRLAEVGVADLR